jgi:hypothetical protein
MYSGIKFPIPYSLIQAAIGGHLARLQEGGTAGNPSEFGSPLPPPAPPPVQDPTSPPLNFTDLTGPSQDPTGIVALPEGAGKRVKSILGQADIEFQGGLAGLSAALREAIDERAENNISRDALTKQIEERRRETQAKIAAQNLAADERRVAIAQREAEIKRFNEQQKKDKEERSARLRKERADRLERERVAREAARNNLSDFHNIANNEAVLERNIFQKTQGIGQSQTEKDIGLIEYAKRGGISSYHPDVVGAAQRLSEDVSSSAAPVTALKLGQAAADTVKGSSFFGTPDFRDAQPFFRKLLNDFNLISLQKDVFKKGATAADITKGLVSLGTAGLVFPKSGGVSNLLTSLTSGDPVRKSASPAARAAITGASKVLGPAAAAITIPQIFTDASKGNVGNAILGGLSLVPFAGIPAAALLTARQLTGQEKFLTDTRQFGDSSRNLPAGITPRRTINFSPINTPPTQNPLDRARAAGQRTFIPGRTLGTPPPPSSPPPSPRISLTGSPLTRGPFPSLSAPAQQAPTFANRGGLLQYLMQNQPNHRLVRRV